MNQPMATLLLLLLAGGKLPAAESQEIYLREVKPLFEHKCSACHGALKQEAGLRLDAASLIHAGGDSGSVVEPGDPDSSYLIDRVTSADDRMPPADAGTPLTAEQVALLREWIETGASAPRDEPIPVDPSRHWAYLRPVRPRLPVEPLRRWGHPIDALLAGPRQRAGVQVVEQADDETLLRRLYFDLVGLPPTRDELHEFLRDSSEDAWSRAVDRLLQRPQYGERWGRHWMDVWRYSDWDGYKEQLRGSQRHIWRWRDWIVASLNADKGYDRMIIEMLAADELAPEDPTRLAATGFLARNYHNSNRNIWLDATVEHTAKAFLGLTINCARCHDHKYDPIPQRDYYAFRAIFEPHQVRTDPLPGELDLKRDGLPRVFDSDLDIQTFVYQQGNEKLPDKEHPVAPAIPAVLGGELHVEPVALPVSAYFPAIRPHYGRDRVEAAKQRLVKAEQALQRTRSGSGVTETIPEDVTVVERKLLVARLELRAIECRRAADTARFAKQAGADAEQLAKQAAAAERRLAAARAHVTVAEKRAALAHMLASDPQRDAGDDNTGDSNTAERAARIKQAEQELVEAETELRELEAQPATAEYTPLGEEYPRTSSGRRLALARWVASRGNPLTARVAVNQLWMRHFGTPLVDNVFDFGRRSPRPTHAKLLDWLAVEFMESGWSMKHIHRLILTSRAWRMRSSSGRVSHRNDSLDPDNRLFWRTNPLRLDAEIVRDSVLAVSGRMDLTIGGPEVAHQQGDISRRRSIYLQHAYEKQTTMLVLFDAASPNECYRRSQSIIPQQALALANSSLPLNASRTLAGRLWHEAVGTEDANSRFVGLAFERILSRRPAETERQACLAFLDRQAATLSDTAGLSKFVGGEKPRVEPAADPQSRARENLVHVLLNHNDFVTVR